MSINLRPSPHRNLKQSPMVVDSALSVAIAAAAIACALAVFMSGAGRATAPEPTYYASASSPYNGGSVGAYYTYTRTPTNGYSWPMDKYYYGPGLPVGAPCAPGNTPAGTTVTTVIVALSPGSPYKKCQ